MINDQLQELIIKYENFIESNNYKAIMNDKEMTSKYLGILLKAFNEAEIKPFTTINETGDIPWFARELWNMKTGWVSGNLVRSWDPMQAFQWATTEGIAKAAYALGANVWYTDSGYYGKGYPDYLISWKPMSTLATCEILEDYDPSEFKAVQWTDSKLYD